MSRQDIADGPDPRTEKTEMAEKTPLERDDAYTVRTIVRDDGTEVGIVDGEELDVVGSPSVPDSEHTPEQRRQMAEVYVRIAGLLPTEGRDYSVSFSFPQGASGPRVSLRGLTPVGRSFVGHLAKNLGKERL